MESSATRTFAAIEGLRSGLAWAVVFSHLAYFSNLSGGIAPTLKATGLPAVLVFLTIGGFVITHPVIERPEPYGVYLLRRFMRIFPLFAVTCATGFPLGRASADRARIAMGTRKHASCRELLMGKSFEALTVQVKMLVSSRT
ncbi:acyltransferase family protein [Nitrobacter sp. TKz-YC02]|uniref:acyltransferase family protein n=1 Tax=Nitrobacter sp. TKz-YC02 TaxID=3398704 RepID=UPI003CF0C60E